eukprot:g7162.t1
MPVRKACHQHLAVSVDSYDASRTPVTYAITVFLPGRCSFKQTRRFRAFDELGMAIGVRHVPFPQKGIFATEPAQRVRELDAYLKEAVSRPPHTQSVRHDRCLFNFLGLLPERNSAGACDSCGTALIASPEAGDLKACTSCGAKAVCCEFCGATYTDTEHARFCWRCGLKRDGAPPSMSVLPLSVLAGGQGHADVGDGHGARGDEGGSGGHSGAGADEQQGERAAVAEPAAEPAAEPVGARLAGSGDMKPPSPVPPAAGPGGTAGDVVVMDRSLFTALQVAGLLTPPSLRWGAFKKRVAAMRPGVRRVVRSGLG